MYNGSIFKVATVYVAVLTESMSFTGDDVLCIDDISNDEIDRFFTEPSVNGYSTGDDSALESVLDIVENTGNTQRVDGVTTSTKRPIELVVDNDSTSVNRAAKFLKPSVGLVRYNPQALKGGKMKVHNPSGDLVRYNPMPQDEVDQPIDTLPVGGATDPSAVTNMQSIVSSTVTNTNTFHTVTMGPATGNQDFVVRAGLVSAGIAAVSAIGASQMHREATLTRNTPTSSLDVKANLVQVAKRLDTMAGTWAIAAAAAAAGAALFTAVSRSRNNDTTDSNGANTDIYTSVTTSDPASGYNGAGNGGDNGK